MNQNYTEIAVVQDKSGSMAGVQKETIQGYNAFVEEQKKVPGKCLLTLTQFNTSFVKVHDGVDINAVPPLTEETYRPDGYTALLDAIGQTINALGKRLSAMPEQERPGKVIVVIITDGEENSSKEFARPAIMQMIETQTKTYKWSFVYLGANQDAIKAGGSIGISASNAMSYSGTKQGTSDAYRSFSSNLVSARCCATQDQADAALAFSDKQRKQQTAAGSTF